MNSQIICERCEKTLFREVVLANGEISWKPRLRDSRWSEAKRMLIGKCPVCGFRSEITAEQLESSVFIVPKRYEPSFASFKEKGVNLHCECDDRLCRLVTPQSRATDAESDKHERWVSRTKNKARVYHAALQAAIDENGCYPGVMPSFPEDYAFSTLRGSSDQTLHHEVLDSFLPAEKLLKPDREIQHPEYQLHELEWRMNFATKPAPYNSNEMFGFCLQCGGHHHFPAEFRKKLLLKWIIQVQK